LPFVHEIVDVGVPGWFEGQPGRDFRNEVMAKIDGNAGKNTLRGTPARDIMDGQGGDDAVFGRGGDDLIYGKAGSDRLYGERGIDYLSGGDGDDVLFGQEDRDRLWGDDGNDLIHGGTGNDDLYGGAGDDNLKGNDGNDHLFGDFGFDRIEGGGGNDEIRIGEGGGRVLGGGGDDRIHVGHSLGEKTLIDGGAGRDRFIVSLTPDGSDDDPYGPVLNVNALITDFESGKDTLSISEGLMTGEGRYVLHVEFDGLDHNQDGVIDENDPFISITKASFWGEKADSLTIDVAPLVSNFPDVSGTITLYGVTELRPGDI
jgi:Ca2+-binding RTX toxin-like protein